MNALGLILVGWMVAWSAALPGAFFMLRRRSMTTDALSHAVLPGLFFGFMLGGDYDHPLVWMGALLTGVLALLLSEWLSRKLHAHEDASLGLVFTGFFALGIVLIARFAGDVHLDMDAVLEGEIAFLPLDAWQIGIHFIPKKLGLHLGLFLVVGLSVFLGYQPLQALSFDPSYAESRGLGKVFWERLLLFEMAMVAVLSFESVGVILLLTFAVVPPATAWLWTNRLWKMLILSGFFGLVSAALGYGIAWFADGSISAYMAVAAGFFFALSAFLAPYGLRHQRVA